MLPFAAKRLMGTMGDLGRAIRALEEESDREQPLLVAKRALGWLERDAAEVPLSRASRTLLRLLNETINQPGYPTATIRTRMYDVETAIQADLDANMYLLIPEVDRELYWQEEPPFGWTVHGSFPKARRDIAAAARCLALDEGTASVFHAMRAIEKGLHYMATLLGVEVRGGVENGEWVAIIVEMEKKIAAMKLEPKTSERASRQEFYNGLAAHFRYFKDGWRNGVAHPRRHYDRREADIVWHHAKDFMELLAKHQFTMQGEADQERQLHGDDMTDEDWE